MGIRGTAHPVRLPDGADDGFLLPERQREQGTRTVDGLALRSLHHPALYPADCSNYSYYANRGRRHRYGRYFQLARDTLDSERYLLPRFHDLRRIVFRGVRDYDAELAREQKRQQSRQRRARRRLFHGTDPRAGIVLMHRADSRFGADQVHLGRSMGAGDHHVRLFSGFRTTVHAFCTLSVVAEKPAQKRRLA